MKSVSEKDCVFCRILDGSLPGSFVYRDELVSAFLDIHPVNPGHILVVPLQHHDSLLGIDFLTVGRMFQVAQKMLKILKATAGPSLKYQGANLFLSEGEVAGQEVPHAHLHIAPRFRGDRHRMGFSGADSDSVSRQELEQLAAALQMNLHAGEEPAVVTGSSWTCEVAQPVDVMEWAEMRHLLWPGSTLQAHQIDAVSMLNRVDMLVLVIKESKRCVGFAEASIRNFANGCETAPVVFLEGIFVREGCRRRGFGKVLVDQVAQWTRQRGLKEIGSDAMSTNQESILAHERWGFEQTELVQYFRRPI